MSGESGGNHRFHDIQTLNGLYRVTCSCGSYFESATTGDAYEQFFSHLKP